MLMSAGKALADPWGRGMGPRLGQRSYVNDDLTPEQSAKMEKIRQDHWKEIVPLRQETWSKKGGNEASRFQFENRGGSDREP